MGHQSCRGKAARRFLNNLPTRRAAECAPENSQTVGHGCLTYIFTHRAGMPHWRGGTSGLRRGELQWATIKAGVMAKARWKHITNGPARIAGVLPVAKAHPVNRKATGCVKALKTAFPRRLTRSKPQNRASQRCPVSGVRPILNKTKKQTAVHNVPGVHHWLSGLRLVSQAAPVSGV